MTVPDAKSDSLNLALKQLDHLCRVVMSTRLRALGIETSYPAAAALCLLEEMPGMSGAQLARWAQVTPQTMNQILTGLERDGLVRREADPVHGRILRAFLTARGLAENRRCEVVSDQLIEDMQAGMSARDRKDFQRLIGRCRDNLQQVAKDVKDVGEELSVVRKTVKTKAAANKTTKTVPKARR